LQRARREPGDTIAHCTLAMVMMAELDERKQTILDALERELEPWRHAKVSKLDLVALAVEIDRALGGDGVMPGEPYDGGKPPDELNAANDG
jgi:hypothetical protein